jgi:predicted nucleic acid-binding protein
MNAALAWARLMAEGRAGGRPRNAFDMLIAAIAESQGCLIVTDNTRDFFGVETLNPLRTSR